MNHTNDLFTFAFRNDALAYAERYAGATVETVYMRYNDYEFYVIVKTMHGRKVYLREDRSFQ